MDSNAINIDNLTLGYENRNIIEDTYANIKKGKITTIIGPNGAGKSTLLKSFGKLLKVKNGAINIFDKNLAYMTQKEVAKKIGILLQQNPCPHDFTVEKLIYIGRIPHKKWYEMTTKEDRLAVERAMQEANIYHMRDKNICTLSGGEKQRVWLAMALAQDTEILLLDEPTTYLDISYQLDMLEFVRDINRSKGLTIIMVLHDLNQAFKYSDEIIVIKNSKIAYQGIPKDLAKIEIIRDIYNIDADIIEIDGYPHIIAKKWRKNNE